MSTPSLPNDLLKGAKILIVDDEEGIRYVLSSTCEMFGATTFTAENGREAIKVLEANTIDVAISDIRMPGGDGMEFLDAAKAMPEAKTRVILMSGFSDVTPEIATERGAAALIAKPFNVRELIELVSSLLATA